MEYNVVSLETAKRLKAAGFPQDERTFDWFENSLDEPYKKIYVQLKNWALDTDIVAAAPTAQEIADQLPLVVAIQADGKWKAYYSFSKKYVSESHDTMAEALAALWLKLKEGQP